MRRISFQYTNKRGRTRERVVLPNRIRFGTTPDHTKQQWILEAFCLHKGAHRSFAMSDINGITSVPDAV